MRSVWIGLLAAALAAATGACGNERVCESRSTTYCHEGVTYWANSCGDLEEIRENCQHGCSADHSVCLGAPLSCRIVSLADEQAVHGIVQVDLALAGPITQVTLMAGAGSIAEMEVAAGSTAVTLEWVTTDLADGPVRLMGQAEAEDGRQALSDPVMLVVDNTLPVASFGPGLARLDTLSGVATVSLSIQEANLASLRVTCAGQEILDSHQAVSEFVWDTSQVPDGIHTLNLEVVDLAGQATSASSPEVVVVNHGEVAEVTYIPAAELVIPENWQSVEHHVRTSAASQPGIQRIISWVTWDAGQQWDIEYAVGQGLCPHRGIRYLAAQSTAGEIVIDLAREDLAPEIVSRLPAADQDSLVFPHNNDPRTFGAFFGHVAVMDPAEHVNQALPIEVHYVFLFAN